MTHAGLYRIVISQKKKWQNDANIIFCNFPSSKFLKRKIDFIRAMSQVVSHTFYIASMQTILSDIREKYNGYIFICMADLKENLRSYF